MARRHQNGEGDPAQADAPAAKPALRKFSVSITGCPEKVVEAASREDAFPAYLAAIGATKTVHLPVIQEVTEDQPGA